MEGYHLNNDNVVMTPILVSWPKLGQWQGRGLKISPRHDENATFIQPKVTMLMRQKSFS